MIWNEERERIIAAAELGDATPQVAVDLLVAARKRAFDAEAAHTWIKTSERMPDPGVKVLILCTDRFIAGEARIAKYYRNDDGAIEWSDDSFDSYYYSKHVVAWMPRPQGEL